MKLVCKLEKGGFVFHGNYLKQFEAVAPKLRQNHVRSLVPLYQYARLALPAAQIEHDRTGFPSQRINESPEKSKIFRHYSLSDTFSTAQVPTHLESRGF